jgi:hypothetical protein
VAGRVALRDDRILGLEQDPAVGVDQNGAEWVVAMGPGGSSDRYRPTQEDLVVRLGRHGVLSSESRFRWPEQSGTFNL